MIMSESIQMQISPAIDVETCKHLPKAIARIGNKSQGSTSETSSSDGCPPIMKIQPHARRYQDTKLLAKLQKESYEICHPNSYSYSEGTAATASMSVSFITSSDSEEANNPGFKPQHSPFDHHSDSDTASNTDSNPDTDHNYEFEDNETPELLFHDPSPMGSKKILEPDEESMDAKTGMGSKENLEPDEESMDAETGFDGSTEEVVSHNRMDQTVHKPSYSRSKEFAEPDLTYASPLSQLDFEENVDLHKRSLCSAKGTRLNEEEDAEDNEDTEIEECVSLRSSSPLKEIVDSEFAHLLPLFHVDFKDDTNSETKLIDMWDNFGTTAVMDNSARSEQTSPMSSFSAFDEISEAETKHILYPPQLDTKENIQTKIKGVHRKVKLQYDESLSILGNCTNDRTRKRSEHLYEYGVKSIMLKREVEVLQRLQRNRKEFSFEVKWRKKQCRTERKKKSCAKPAELTKRLYNTSRSETCRMEGRKRRENIAKRMVLREEERENDFRFC